MSAKIKYPIVNGLKQCGDCGKRKPLIEFNKARNYYTSRCHDCLKVYSKIYRDSHKEVAKEYHLSYMANPDKRALKNAYQRQRNKREDVRQKRNLDRRVWALREKQKAVDYKDGRCVVCGYNKCLGAMDFHHKNPCDKEGYGTGALKQHWTFEHNKDELDKCILVCVRCHREIHAGVVVL